jgi:hypothetical protein
LPVYLSSKPTFQSIAALTKRPTEQPVEVQGFNTGRVVRVNSDAEKAADATREKKERRAAYLSIRTVEKRRAHTHDDSH